MKFKHIYPEFQNGSILKSSLLEELRDFPNIFLNLQYENYGNGILAGLNIDEIKEDDDTFILTKGIIKLNGKFWLLSENFEFDRNLKKNCNLVFSVYDGVISFIDKEEYNRKKHFLLAEIKYDGGQLYGEIDKFDFYNANNRIVRKSIPQSVPGGRIPLQRIINLFGKEQLEKKGIENEPIDFNFALLCLGNQITYQQIISYLKYKKAIKDEKKILSPAEIYDKLLTINKAEYKQVDKKTTEKTVQMEKPNTQELTVC